MRPLALALALALGLAPAGAAQIVLAPPTTSAMAPQLGALLAGDFDGDGDLDLVLGRPPVGGGEPSVALNQGDGTFVEGQDLTGAAFVANAIDDVDGDGVLDLVMVASGPASHPVVRLGNGDGTFGAEVALPEADGFLQIRTADVDGDGDRDLVLGAQSLPPLGLKGGVTVRLNDGEGNFGVDLPVAPFDGGRVAAGDMNGDGHDDVVIASTVGGVTAVGVELSNGDGTFTLQPFCPGCTGMTGGAIDAALADLDGDGDLDLATLIAPFVGGSMRVHMNDGAGQLASPLLPGLDFMQALELADLDGDGLPEIIGKDLSNDAFPAPREVSILPNLGGGLFGARIQVTVGDVPQDLIAADLDGDGRIDVAVVDQLAGLVAVARNATYLPGEPFDDLGHSLHGAPGFPVQIAAGTLLGGTALSIDIGNGPPAGQTFAFVGLTAINAPFKGGTLVPIPTFLFGPLPLDAQGDVSIGTTWPAGVPAGTEVFWQFWSPDGGAPLGFSATSAVRATQP